MVNSRRSGVGDATPHLFPDTGISVVILTFNSEAVLGATIASAAEISDDIHIVDSFSRDRTLEIARSYGAAVVQRPFENYGAQRNWAIGNLILKHSWELHLDADERLSEELIREIRNLRSRFPQDIDGYFIARLTCFLGRPIRHGGMFPTWHMRLFRRNTGRCESRLYDQHFYVNGRASRLRHPIIDDQRNTIAEWVTRHNRWAQAEVDEILLPLRQGPGIIQGRWSGDPVQRKRALRRLYYRIPLFFRAPSLFLYRYVLRLGFLDGREGLIFFVLQTFWFRFLIDAMVFERQKVRDAVPASPKQAN
jgi:glycosyltransferase involved in cell wall biosynthesis